MVPDRSRERDRERGRGGREARESSPMRDRDRGRDRRGGGRDRREISPVRSPLRAKRRAGSTTPPRNGRRDRDRSSTPVRTTRHERSSTPVRSATRHERSFSPTYGRNNASRSERGRRDRSLSPNDVRNDSRSRMLSPVRNTRYERSPSSDDARGVRQRRRRSPRVSPRPERGSRHEQHGPASASAAARDENMAERSNERDRHSNDVDVDQDDSIAKMNSAKEALEAKEKEKPSFEYSGKLAAETNKVKGVTLLFTEPPESRKPSTRWRLYVFKDGEPLNDPLYIHRQPCYRFGRERRVADIPTDHPSCSKQHAVIQYRLTEKEEPDGTTTSKVSNFETREKRWSRVAGFVQFPFLGSRVKLYIRYGLALKRYVGDCGPYVMDLGSTNGTHLNGERIEAQRFYEMFEKDTIKFGNSSREYVLLHEHSAG